MPDSCVENLDNSRAIACDLLLAPEHSEYLSTQPELIEKPFMPMW
jgi:hypothetical protein